MSQSRQLAAIMFTDIVGYTALMGKDSAKALELVHISKEIQKPLVEKHHGQWLKEMGDGAMAKFNTALDAVNCAVEIQEIARGKLEAKLRIGIHLGDITIENEDVYGDGVNVASRLESIADPGGIYISESIEKAIQGQTDVQAKYLGEVKLKNVAYGVRTYAVQGVGLPIAKVRGEKKLYAGYIIIVLMVVASALYIYWNFQESSKASTESVLKIVPLTSSTNELQLSSNWSPDGSFFSYWSFRQGNSDIVVTATGSESSIRLTNTPFDELLPRWSSDNDKVIFISNRGGKEDIWSISIDEKELKQITSLNKRVLYPVVTNGGNLVFDIWDHRTDLFSLNLKTKEEKQHTFHHGNNFHPRISPDGESIIYQSDRTGDYEIWQYNLKTENETRLTINPASDIKADWSPDGKSIVFLSNRDKEPHLWIMDIESGKTDRLTTEGIKMPGYILDYAMNVKWSPDGKTIGYIAQGQNGRSVWLIDPSGENQRIGLGDIHSFDWYLTNNLIVYNRLAKSKDEYSELRIHNLKTGADSLLYSGRLTEIFTNHDGSALGFIEGNSHWSQNIYMLKLERPNDISQFPKVLGKPQQITNGKGIWHAHNGTWNPNNTIITYIRDQDEGNIFKVENIKF